jgi:hypothetical protein
MSIVHESLKAKARNPFCKPALPECVQGDARRPPSIAARLRGRQDTVDDLVHGLQEEALALKSCVAALQVELTRQKEKNRELKDAAAAREVETDAEIVRLKDALRKAALERQRCVELAHSAEPGEWTKGAGSSARGASLLSQAKRLEKNP